MPKARWKEVEGVVEFKCPGCGYLHVAYITNPHYNGAQWKWNFDVERPTIYPSILNRSGKYVDPNYKWDPADGPDPSSICHAIIKKGTIYFAPDSTHALSGQTVDLPEL